MICDELGTSCREVVPAIAASEGIGIATTWFLVAFLLIGAVVILIGLLRASSRPAPTPPMVRPVVRCSWLERGYKCTAPATRMVGVLDSAHPGMSTRVMCDDDAHRLTRAGRAVDLGPIR